MISNKDTLGVIGTLYDAATDMDKWPVFLEELASLFDANVTNIVHFDPSEERFNFFVLHGFDYQQEDMIEFQEIFSEDPRVQMCSQFPGKPIGCQLSVGKEVWYQSKTYALCERIGLGSDDSISVVLPEEDGTMTALGVTRDKHKPSFTQDDCDFFGEFIPHIKRAIELQKKFATTDFSKRSAMEIIDHMPTGVIATNGDGVVQHINAAARRIVERSDGISLVGDSLFLMDKEENMDMRLAINQAVTAARQGSIIPGHAIMATRALASEGYPLMISTLWGNHIKLGFGALDAPLAVVFITDPDIPQEAPAEVLQRLYGLTRSEASLLTHLVAGRNIKEASGDLGLTEGTARQYVKLMLQKTGARRQADLVRLVLTSPIWPGNPSSLLVAEQ